MTRLDDALIQQLATQETPRAYWNEVRSMAQEILAYRAEAAKAAATAAQTAAQAAAQASFPYGFGPGSPP